MESLRAKSSPKEKPTAFSTHVSQLRNCHHVLLMTCCVKIVGPDGSTTQARALVDSTLSASFITERLAQHFYLARRNHSINISGIGVTTNQLSSHGVANFSVACPDNKGKIELVEALIQSKITSTLPLHPVSLDTKWKHVDGLQLSHPEFSMPGNVDLLLGADIFSRVVFHGQQFGPSGSPSAFKLHFGWMDSGWCYSHWAHFTGLTKFVLCLDHHGREFKRGWHVKETLGDWGSQHQATSSALSLDEHTIVDHCSRTHCGVEQENVIVKSSVQQQLNSSKDSMEVEHSIQDVRRASAG